MAAYFLGDFDLDGVRFLLELDALDLAGLLDDDFLLDEAGAAATGGLLLTGAEARAEEPLICK